MAYNREKRQRADYMASAGVMLALVIFALCCVSMLLYSAESCKDIADRGAEAWEKRTCQQYLKRRVWQGDMQGAVYAASLKGKDALVLTEMIDGESYSTWIYCSGGRLREYFAESSAEPDPEAGVEVMEAKELYIDTDGNLLTIRTDLTDGTQVCVDICLRSMEEGTE